MFALIAERSAERDLNRDHPFKKIELIRRSRAGAMRLKKEDGGKGVSLSDFIGPSLQPAKADPNVAARPAQQAEAMTPATADIAVLPLHAKPVTIASRRNST